MSEIKIYYTRILDLCEQLIPKRIGAYVVTHTTDNVYAEKYVGSTTNLYKRIYGHSSKEIIYIDLYITDDTDLAESLERILIELINPATNVQIPSLSENDKEIMNELLQSTNIKEHISDNVIRIGYRYLKYFNKKEKYEYNIHLNYGTIRIEIRSLTETQCGRMISFNKEYLDEINFKEGRYEVTYDNDKITISRIKNNNVVKS